jgi:catechol 2,3-dioxygenase
MPDTHAEPMFDVAHFCAVELYSPKRQQSVDFFTNLMGMYIVREDSSATYLRGYEDPYAYSLKVSDRAEPGPGMISFRAQSANALERRATALTAAGLGDGWVEKDFGHGRAFRYHTPDGHKMQLLWDVDYATVTDQTRTGLLNRPTKRPSRGVPVRRIDHINLYCSDVTTNKAALVDHLGFRMSENIVLNNGVEAACWLRTTALVHDVAFSLDRTGEKGRLHHVCFWYGIPQHLMDLAELCAENGIFVEAGPGKHGISQGLFLYLMEPGGNRIELFGDSGYLIFDPTWKPVTWTEAQLAKGIIWVGSDLPGEFFLYGTPNVGENETARRIGVI